LKQKIIDPPETTPEQRPLSKPHIYCSKVGSLCLLALLVVALLSFSVNLVQGLVQAGHVASTPFGQVTTTARGSQTGAAAISNISVPGHENALPLQLPSGRSVIYSQSNSLYLVSLTGGSTTVIPTTGFISNRAAQPILTPGGQILYSGDGIWLTDVSGGTPQRIAALGRGQVAPVEGGEHGTSDLRDLRRHSGCGSVRRVGLGYAHLSISTLAGSWPWRRACAGASATW